MSITEPVICGEIFLSAVKKEIYNEAVYFLSVILRRTNVSYPLNILFNAREFSAEARIFRRKAERSRHLLQFSSSQNYIFGNITHIYQNVEHDEDHR